MVNVHCSHGVLMGTRLPNLDDIILSNQVCGGGVSLSSKEKRKKLRKRLPNWFKTSLPIGESQARYNDTKGSVKENNLNTVCEEARCPNIHDCWGRGTATFMIAGEVCT